MRKIVSLSLAAVLGCGLLAGCGKLDVTRDTVYIQKNGKVTAASVDKLDKDYYSAEELEEYVNQTVAEYTAANDDKSLKVELFEAEEGNVKLNLKYASVQDYVSFNGTELFSGTVADAKSAGYDFDTSFSSVEEGAVTSEADAATILSEGENKIVITNEPVDVKIDGTVLYISSEGTSMVDKSTVSIAEPAENQVLGLNYIIYK